MNNYLNDIELYVCLFNREFQSCAYCILVDKISFLLNPGFQVHFQKICLNFDGSYQNNPNLKLTRLKCKSYARVKIVPKKRLTGKKVKFTMLKRVFKSFQNVEKF